MSKSRILLLFFVLVLVAAVAAAGWYAGTRIESPAEAAARTAPPTPSTILVPVEARVLSSNIVTRGTARFGLPQPISLAPSTLKPGIGLITTLPMRNAQFKEGDVMLTASGRPVFALQGEIPAYRDMVPGMSGDDVRQLEQSLERLGFDPGPIDGAYDEETAAAVAKWYESAKREPFWPTPEQLANIRTLEQNLSAATRNHLAGASAVASAAKAVAAARARADHAEKSANADIRTGIADRALIVLDPRQLATARAAADAKIEVARAALKAAQLEGAVTIQAAIDAQQVAELDAKLAADLVDRLSTDLELAKRKLGVQVPVDEIAFIPALPVRAEELMVRVGAPASGPVLSVTDNQIVIDSSLPLAAAPLVKPGMEVAIDEQSLGIKTTGIVDYVAGNPGTRGVDGYHRYFSVLVGESPTPLEGFSLRLTIPIQSTKGVVTTVPVSALMLSADGTSRIQIKRDGDFEYVVVQPGLSAGGFVEVIPIDGTLAPGDLVVVGE